MSRKQLTYAGIAFAGGALGVALGMLFAPAPGRETRRRVARTIGDRKDALIRAGYQAREGVTEYLRAS
jgi:gas vesicle protein